MLTKIMYLFCFGMNVLKNQTINFCLNEKNDVCISCLAFAVVACGQ
jgi:hypothetical protein